MATTKKAKKQPAAPAVSRAEFDALAKGVGDLVEMIKNDRLQAPKDVVEKKQDEEVTKAAPNKFTVNPDWEEMAKKIIGEAVDHTEIQYLKGGGMLFTVVIKPEFSNAPLDYLDRYKIDRRSKEVGAEGEAGVQQWCDLIKNNLKRERAYIN